MNSRYPFMKLWHRGSLIGTILLAGFLIGCGQRPLNSTTTAPGVELTEVTTSGFDAILAEQKGKVVYVDVWFLGCPPCVERFPHVVELHKKYADQGLVVMSVDVNVKELKKQDKVLVFLSKHEAKFPNYILTDEKKVVDAWQVKNKVEYTPGEILIDRDGKRIEIPEDARMDEIEAVMKKLLAAK